MNKLEIVSGSLKITKDGIVILVVPKNSCEINVLDLYSPNPRIVIFNKYLANFTTLFSQPLSVCVDATNTPFTDVSFIAFAEANFGF